LSMEAAALSAQADVASAAERSAVLDYASEVYETDPFFKTLPYAVNNMYSQILRDMEAVA